MTLCGANIWYEAGLRGLPLKDRLFEYVGPANIKGSACYQFLPYKRKGYPIIVPVDMLDVSPVKPLLIDTKCFLGLTHD
jgi:hypothetical protein